MDIVVFEIGARRSAVDLRLVHGVLSLGPLTSVPLGPPSLAGAMNVRGHVVPVIDPGVLLGEPPASPRPGEPGLLLELDGREVLFRVGRVDGVARLEGEGLLPGAARPRVECEESRDPPGDRGHLHPGPLGREVQCADDRLFLLDAEAVVQAVVHEISTRSAALCSGLRPVVLETPSPERPETEP